jgi:hypothetical protein
MQACLAIALLVGDGAVNPQLLRGRIFSNIFFNRLRCIFKAAIPLLISEIKTEHHRMYSFEDIRLR